MIDWNVNAIRQVLIEAGRIAISHFENPTTEHKADNSLVTQADRDVETYLRAQLQGADQSTYFLGEESVDNNSTEFVDRALAGTTWVVDPIDGTAPYANGLPNWGVSIGHMKAGRLENGAVFLPRSGEMLITDSEQVLYQQESRDPERWQFDKLEPLTNAKRGYESKGMISVPQEIARKGRFTGRNPIQANGSAVYSGANLILGGYLAYVARVKLWDFAGVLPMFDRLGFIAAHQSGEVVTLQIQDKDWVLDPTSPRCWKSTELIFVARSRETLQFVIAHYESTSQRSSRG